MKVRPRRAAWAASIRRSKRPMLWPTSIAPSAAASSRPIASAGGRPSRARRSSERPWNSSDSPTGIGRPHQRGRSGRPPAALQPHRRRSRRSRRAPRPDRSSRGRRRRSCRGRTPPAAARADRRPRTSSAWKKSTRRSPRGSTLPADPIEDRRDPRRASSAPRRAGHPWSRRGSGSSRGKRARRRSRVGGRRRPARR